MPFNIRALQLLFYGIFTRVLVFRSLRSSIFAFEPILVSMARANSFFAFWTCARPRPNQRTHNHNFNLCCSYLVVFLRTRFRFYSLSARVFWAINAFRSCLCVPFFLRSLLLLLFVNKSRMLVRSVWERGVCICLTHTQTHTHDLRARFILNWPLLHSHWCFHIQITNRTKKSITVFIVKRRHRQHKINNKQIQTER